MSTVGVTSPGAVESSIEQPLRKSIEVFIVGASGSLRRCLEHFGIFDFIQPENQMVRLLEVLCRVVDSLGRRAGIYSLFRVSHTSVRPRRVQN